MTSDAELSLATLIGWCRLPLPETEFRFHTGRRWRFDFAWPAQKVALEVEGGVYVGGRHTRGAGFEADIEKYNAATLAGWRLFRVTPGMIDDGRAVALLEAVLR